MFHKLAQIRRMDCTLYYMISQYSEVESVINVKQNIKGEEENSERKGDRKKDAFASPRALLFLCAQLLLEEIAEEKNRLIRMKLRSKYFYYK